MSRRNPYQPLINRAIWLAMALFGCTFLYGTYLVAGWSIQGGQAAILALQFDRINSTPLGRAAPATTPGPPAPFNFSRPISPGITRGGSGFQLKTDRIEPGTDATAGVEVRP